MKRIFTFWEPKENIPGYLELCLASWKKYLPDYEIVILDYSNLENWLGRDFYPQVLYEKFSLPIQADAIRCALLNKYGGIWMDIDTIITSDKIKQYLTIDSELTLINNHIAFIAAKHIEGGKEGKILRNWQKKIFFNLKIAKNYYDTKTPQIIRKLLQKFFQKNFLSWDCMGNRILKRSLKTKNKKLFYKINSVEIKCFPEIEYKKINNIITQAPENYANFYFKHDYSDFALENNGGIILLHNSWTPEEYKKMSREEFLKTNNTLSKILQKIL